MKLKLPFKTVQTVLLFLLCLAVSTFAEGQGFTVSGRVLDNEGRPVAGATVIQKGTHNGTITDEKGQFSLTGSGSAASLFISSIGYEKQEVKADASDKVTVTLKRSSNELDQTVIRAYGTTTRRLNTGDISTVTAKEIAQQPVANPLAALEGRVPGLVVTQTSGVPGAAFNVQIRGKNSIAQGSEPLIIIDGVPFAPGNTGITQINSAATPNGTSLGLSPLNSIDPSEIESIEVLKDADATAIYGSRGANGVILITTKKGVAGKTSVDVSAYTGISKVTNMTNMLNTRQYLEMRREAFYNDKAKPTTSSAPDLLVWDTTRYTNLENLLMGGTAHTTDAHASVSGGNMDTRFLIGGGYHKETTVYPGDMGDNRGSMHLSLDHHSKNRRFSVSLSSIYSSDRNDLMTNNIASSITLPPDIPSLYTEQGKLNWEEGGVSFSNPLAYLLRQYTATTNNLLSNLLLTYKLSTGLNVKVNGGYNVIQATEKSTLPIAAQNPSFHPHGFASFANSLSSSLIIEPQFEYAGTVSQGKLDILAGGSWQENGSDGSEMDGSGYTSDALLGSISAAGDINATNNSSQYKYEAVFGRINYNWQDKYIMNLSGRRDGSSRFGPGRQFSNFGAIGAAWIFSNENFIKSALPFISYGKIRGSYGTTGNDQIGDYQFMDSWSNTTFPYQNIPGLIPSRLYNPDYSWEINRKLEVALELGLLHDHILFSGSYFRNRSNNQLVQYNLPHQTGFSSVIKNFPAVVQNTGFELTLTANRLTAGAFEWTGTIDLTIPHNELLSFPGLDYSSYSSKLVEGKPLNLINGYHHIGVDSKTGLYEFESKDGSPVSLPTSDDYMKGLGSLDPDFYGGFNNSFQYKRWELDVFFEFRKQLGENYFASLSQPPGNEHNYPVAVLRRWQRPGDKAPVQMFSQNYGSPFYAQYYLSGSNGIYGDASFIRLKSLSLSYGIPAGILSFLHIPKMNIYIQGQNLLTFTRYMGMDPETQSFYNLPPLKTLTAGIHFTF